MSNLGYDALREPVEHSFCILNAAEQMGKIHELNLGIVSSNGTDKELNMALQETIELGYKPFRWQNVVIVAADVIQAEGIVLPSGNVQQRNVDWWWIHC